MTRITTADAPTLDDLADMLNTLVQDELEAGRNAEPVLVRVSDRYDLTSLPTYGGEDPADTLGLYSWDETRLLYCDGPEHRPWVAAPREQ